MALPPSGRIRRTAPVNSGQMGWCYTVHFERPIKTAAPPQHWPQHVTGWALDVDARLHDHVTGRGSKLFALAEEQGIGWDLAQVERGDRNRERQLKQHSTTRRCPRCREETRENPAMNQPTNYNEVVEYARRLAESAGASVDLGALSAAGSAADQVAQLHRGNLPRTDTVDNDRGNRQKEPTMTTHREASRETQLGQVFITCECGHRETSPVAETDIAGRNMRFHVQTERNAGRTLNDIMDIDHVIQVHADGKISNPEPRIWAPELVMFTADDGQILAEHEEAYEAEARRQGWELLKGWTGQYGYSGFIMHPSEYIGGSLADYIRETPGTYVAIAIEDDTDSEEPAGWAVARRIEPDHSEQRKAMVESGEPQRDLAANRGPQWTTDEMTRDFEVTGFAAPFVVVRRKSDGRVGTLEFTHSPRVYFGFVGDGPDPEPETKGADMITKDDAMTGSEFHENHEPAGKIFTWRRNGATQTWVTRPDEFRIPVKYGLKNYGQITQNDAHNFHRADQCPTRHVRVRIPEERGGGEWFGIVITEHTNPDGQLNGITRVQVTTKGGLRGPGTRVGAQIDVSSRLVEDL